MEIKQGIEAVRKKIAIVDTLPAGSKQQDAAINDAYEEWPTLDKPERSAIILEMFGVLAEAKQDDILNELASIQADENTMLSNAIKDAEAAIRGIVTDSTPQNQ